MDGPSIITTSLSRPAVRDRQGRIWQYHSRSDRHSKIACWAILFDLLQTSRLLAKHAAEGSVGFGLNHEMREYTTNRKKKLDFVVCTPRGDSLGRDEDFAQTRLRFGVELSQPQSRRLEALPALRFADVGQVRMALEAKAAMTAHIRAIPRLFDELNSSHHTVHAASDGAIAAGFVMINTAPTFISSDLNKMAGVVDVVSPNQPHGAARVLGKLFEIPRRVRRGQDGFDAFGVLLVSMRNDGTAVTAEEGPDNGSSVLRYENLIGRLAEAYDSRYA